MPPVDSSSNVEWIRYHMLEIRSATEKAESRLEAINIAFKKLVEYATGKNHPTPPYLPEAVTKWQAEYTQHINHCKKLLGIS